MEAKDWIQILVGIVILGTLAWLGVTVFDMNRTVASVDVRTQTTNDRVDRIAQALPELGRRIAWEELSGSIMTALATTKAYETDQGKWEMLLHVFNPKVRVVKSFKVSLTGPNDTLPILGITGSVYSAEPAAATFAQLKEWSHVAQEPTAVPDFIQLNRSFVMRGEEPDAYIKSVPFLTVPVKTTYLKTVVTNWRTLAKELNENFDTYSVDKTP